MVVGGVEVSDYNKGNKNKLKETKSEGQEDWKSPCWCRRKSEFTLKWITSLCILIRSVLTSFTARQKSDLMSKAHIYHT